MCNNQTSKYQRYRKRHSEAYKAKNRLRMRKKRQKSANKEEATTDRADCATSAIQEEPLDDLETILGKNALLTGFKPRISGQISAEIQANESAEEQSCQSYPSVAPLKPFASEKDSS